MNRFQLSAIALPDLLLLQRELELAIKERKREDTYRRRISKWKQKSLGGPTPVYEKDIKTSPEVVAFNESAPLSIPGRKRYPYQSLLRLFPSLIKQDWSCTYPEKGGEEKFYVYAHVDPTKTPFRSIESCGSAWGGEPFYIGKGCGSRAYDLKRNQGHGKRIKGLLEREVPPDMIVKVIWDGLTEQKALELEAKCIYYFGSIYEPGKLGQRGCLLNLDIPQTPNFEGSMISLDLGIVDPKEVREVVVEPIVYPLRTHEEIKHDLIKRYPNLFGVVTPLKGGIEKDLLALEDRQFSSERLKSFLYSWFGSLDYQTACANGEFRYGLNGETYPMTIYR